MKALCLSSAPLLCLFWNSLRRRSSATLGIPSHCLRDLFLSCYEHLGNIARRFLRCPPARHYVTRSFPGYSSYYSSYPLSAVSAASPVTFLATRYYVEQLPSSVRGVETEMQHPRGFRR
ncbi:hypothetical protein BC834DRAFT_666440 [Gloeopeniophorella convolvens]|nr:hypothetical protein BC834DRAFT_666440 [Gloeopeniophorella convolvens]